MYVLTQEKRRTYKEQTLPEKSHQNKSVKWGRSPYIRIHKAQQEASTHVRTYAGEE